MTVAYADPAKMAARREQMSKIPTGADTYANSPAAKKKGIGPNNPMIMEMGAQQRQNQMAPMDRAQQQGPPPGQMNRPMPQGNAYGHLMQMNRPMMPQNKGPMGMMMNRMAESFGRSQNPMMQRPPDMGIARPMDGQAQPPGIVPNQPQSPWARVAQMGQQMQPPTQMRQPPPFAPQNTGIQGGGMGPSPAMMNRFGRRP